MIGLPTVSLRLSSTGQYGQIAARLWDISPEGTQMLVSRGVYALDNGQAGELDLPAARQRLPLRQGPHRPARAARPRLALLPARQRPLHRPRRDVKVELPTLQRKPR